MCGSPAHGQLLLTGRHDAEDEVKGAHGAWEGA